MIGSVKSAGRERNNMILYAIYQVADATTMLCAYEDIVVRAWKLFPQEFGLRGYVDQYPDSSDLHKPLYGPLKREGYVRVHNKKFGLTDSGLAVVEEFRTRDHALHAPASRVRRDQLIEIERLGNKPALALMRDNLPDQLLDTDLYDFYGVTVRTKPTDFAGRIATVDLAVDAALAAEDPSIDRERLAWIARTRDALKSRHSALIQELTAVRGKLKS
jgi:hypothetical protein